MNAPPRRNRPPAALTQCGDGEDLLAVFNGARAGDDGNLLAADFGAVGKFDDGAFRAERAAGELVGRADAVHVEHAGQHFELGQVEAGGGADAGQNGLHGAGGAMHVDAGLFHGVDDGIDLFFGCFLLHGDNHCFVPCLGRVGSPATVFVAGVTLRPRRGPAAQLADSTAWAFLSEANSFRCNARITSMMRS